MDAVAEVSILSDVRGVVESTLKIPSAKLNIDAEFESFGMDSIIAMELMANLAKKFNISMTPAQFTDVNTVRELASYIEGKVGSGSAVAVEKREVVRSAAVLKTDTAVRETTFEMSSLVTRSAFHGRSANRSAKVSFQRLLAYINKKYAIDLAYQRFNSTDEIIDALLTNHVQKLLDYYDLNATEVAAEFDSRNNSQISGSRPLVSAQQYQDLAIVGISCKLPDTANPNLFWDNLIDKISQYVSESYPATVENLRIIRADEQADEDVNPGLEVSESMDKVVAAELRELVSDVEENGVTPLLAIDKRNFSDFPLSFAQERLFFLEQMEPEAGRHNVPIALAINGELNIALLQQAFNQLISRHDSLRTRFFTRDGEVRQQLVDRVDFKLNLIDLRHYQNSEVRLRKARDMCLQEAAAAFDLSLGPLLRASVIYLAEQQHILMLNMHHISSDGWSVGILIKELGLIMESLRQGKSPDLPELAIQYLDYCIWQRSSLVDGKLLPQRLAYWQEKLAGVAETLDLVADYPSLNGQNTGGASYKFELETGLTEQLFDFARSYGTTPYMTLLAAFKVLFSGYAGQEDICIGSVNANRDFATAGVIGCFFNVVPLRSQVSGNKSFVQLLADVKQAMLEAYEHQLPIEKITQHLAAQSLSNSSGIVNVLFNQLPPSDARVLPFAGASLQVFDYGQNETLNLSDLSIFIGVDQSAVRFELVYPQQLYQCDSIAAMAQEFTCLLSEIIADQQVLIGNLLDKLNLAKRKKIQFIGSYNLDPILLPSRIVAAKLPQKPKVSVAGYNQVLQQLMAVDIAANSVLAVMVMLEDCYRYQADASLGEKKATVEKYCELLRSALTQTRAQSVILLLHESFLERVVDVDELAMLASARKLLLKQLQSVEKVFLLDEQSIVKHYPIASDKYDSVRDREGHIPFVDEHYVAMAAEVFRSYYQQQLGQEKKLIVVDCDNSLWLGAVAEEGVDGIEIPPYCREFQQQLKQKKAEGFIIALCSKNQEADIDAVFANRPDMVLQPEDIALKKINWEAKSKNIQAIASELNIGMDSIVFLDDNPLEIDEVRTHCPQAVSLLLPRDKPRLANWVNNLWCCDKNTVTREDRQRSALMKQHMERRKLQQSFDYLSFIRQLEIEISIAPMVAEELTRVSQLTRRSNQFNANKREYSEAEIVNFIKKANCFCKTVKVRDKFGDYGLVGVMLYRQREKVVKVEQFLLSCRALGRNIEEAMIKHLAEDKKMEKIAIKFNRTDRNQPLEKFLKTMPGRKYNGYYEIDREEIIIAGAGHAYSESQAVVKSQGGLAATDKSGVKQRAEELFLMDMANEYASVEKLQQTVKQFFPTTIAAGRSSASYAPPATKIEQQLIAIWSEVLNLQSDGLGINDDFFACGGHSLLALKIIARIEAQFKLTLPLTILFSARTVAAMAKLIVNSQSVAFNILVPMQPEGDRVPIFAVPGAAGNLMSLQPLSNALGKRQPFYGLQPISEAETIEEIAAANIAALKQLQSAGPYHLLGYSNGGVVTFAMARMLLEQNEKVSLTLIDSLCPILRVSAVIDELVEVCNNLISALGGNLNLQLSDLQAIPEAERSQYLYRRMAAHGLELTLEQFEASYHTALRSESLCRSYQPQQISQPLDVVLYRATAGYADMPEDYGWNKLLKHPISICNIDADHLSIIYAGPVAKIAEKMIATSGN